MLELMQAEEYACYKGDLVISLPEGSYTTEEMWSIIMEMLKTSITIQDKMRRHFESLPGSTKFTCSTHCVSQAFGRPNGGSMSSWPTGSHCPKASSTSEISK